MLKNMDKLRPINWIQWITLGIVVALCITIPFVVREINIAISGAANVQRAFICYIEQGVIKDKQETPQQKKATIEFFNKFLVQINEPNCNKGR